MQVSQLTSIHFKARCSDGQHELARGVGSGGTVAGLSRYFARVAPHVEMVLADPVGSVLADYIRTGRIGSDGSWVVEGIGADFLLSIADLSRVRAA